MSRPLKILLLTYRGNPFCGGQGIYVSHLAREMARLGHEVHCLEGPPYFEDGAEDSAENNTENNAEFGGEIATENGTGNGTGNGAGYGAGNGAWNGTGKNGNPGASGRNGDENDGGNFGGDFGGDSCGPGTVTWHQVPGMHLWSNGKAGGGQLAEYSPLRLFERVAAWGGQFPEMTSFSWRAFARLRSLLKRRRFDVVHDNQSLGWGLLAIQALGFPTLATVHHPLTIDRARGFDPPAGFRERLNKVRFYPLLMQGFVARRMSHIVTVSQSAAEAIARDFRIPPARIRVILNGLDSERFRPLPGVKRVPGRVVFVGNLEDPNKGGKYLLQALASLPPPAHLVVATGGISRHEWLDGQVERLGLRGRITLEYRVSQQELVRLYASAQVAVSPSLYEGFGFPAVEAMACGLPLVAARGGALPEVVGDAGVLVPVADAGALAAAVGDLLGDGEKRERLGRLARQRVRERFRWDTAARQLTEVYRETIDAHH